MVVPRRGSGSPVTRVFSLYVVQAGSALPAGAGRPAPTAFNRAGEKLRAARGELPRVSDEVVLDAGGGLALPLIGEEGLGRRAGAVGSAGQAASAGRRAAGGAGGDGGIPAGAVDDHGVDPAQQRGGARDAGLGAPRAGRGCAALACRDPARGSRPRRRRPGSSPRTWRPSRGCDRSSGHTARQTVSRRPGRPRREMCAWPAKAPEALSDGDSPACLTSDDELSYRRGSPVSAKIAAAPTAVSPGMSASRDRPSSPSTAAMSASTARSWARVRCRSPSSSAHRRSRPRR